MLRQKNLASAHVKSTRCMLGLEQKIDDMDLLATLNTENVRLHNISEDTEEIKSVVEAINKYCATGEIEDTLATRDALQGSVGGYTHTQTVANVFSQIHDMNVEKTKKLNCSGGKARRRIQWFKGDIFAALWLNTLGAKSTDVLCGALTACEEEALAGTGGRRETIAESINRMTIDDMQCLSGKVKSNQLDDYAEQLYRNHIRNHNVEEVTKDIINKHKKQRLEVMCPRTLNTEKLYHELLTFLVEPAISRRMFLDYWRERPDAVQLITLNLINDQDISYAVDQLETTMSGKVVSVMKHLPVIRRQIHKLTFPDRFLLTGTDSSPMLDCVFNEIRGMDFSDVKYMHGWNVLERFEDLTKTDDILQSIRQLEHDHLDMEKIRNDRKQMRDQLTYHMKFLFTKMVLFVVWLTTYNCLMEADQEKTLAVGQMNNFGDSGGEDVLVDWYGPGKDSLRMNANTIYYDGRYFYGLDNNNAEGRTVYRCKDYRGLVVMLRE